MSSVSNWGVAVLLRRLAVVFLVLGYKGVRAISR